MGSAPELRQERTPGSVPQIARTSRGTVDKLAALNMSIPARGTRVQQKYEYPGGCTWDKTDCPCTSDKLSNTSPP